MLETAFVEGVSALLGLCLVVVIAFSRRLAFAAWHLVVLVTCSSVASAALCVGESWLSITESSSQTVAFSILLLAPAAGLSFSMLLERRPGEGRVGGRSARVLVYMLSAAAILALRVVLPADEDELSASPGFLTLGVGGFAAALYLLGGSVLVLVNLERTMRKADEHVRWELKFIVLGVYVSFAALIYIASRMLLYSPSECRLATDTLRVYPPVFGVACLLILSSWRRLSGAGVVVSQKVVYGSITMLGVGLYLIASSLTARWIGAFVGARTETQAVIFLLSALGLALVILSTRVRHRLRYWVRRNFYSGRYDYRTSWLEATERIHSNVSPDAIAGTLGEIIVKALDALDVTVWLRSAEAGGLRLCAVRGCTGGSPPREIRGVLSELQSLNEPTPLRAAPTRLKEAMGEEVLKLTKAALLAPLRSGGATLGLVTVGQDQSGRAFEQEAKEFLRVLAAHGASEIHNAELIALQVEAKESEAFRSFATFLLHDLKNFASTLSLIAKNAQRHRENPEFQRDAFQSVLETSEKMKRICNSLRTFTGTLAVQRTSQDLNRIVRESLGSFDRSLSARVCLELKAIPPLMVDDAEVSRVVQNLVLNAIEAISPEGSISVQTEVRDERVVLTVADDGQGIPKEFLERELFHPFKTTKSSGLGIGLFQSKRIVEAHGAAIRVQSEEGKGTIVTVSFPMSVQGVEAQG